MKTTLISRISLAVLSLLTVCNLFAQEADFKNDAAFKFSSDEISQGLPDVSTNIYGKTENINVNTKLLKTFKKQFENVDEVEWSPVKNYFLAKFKKDGMLIRSLFNKNGKIIYTIEFLSEKQLPPNVRRMVKKQYYDYAITSAAKVAEANREIWVIKMAGETNYVSARVEGGEMEETENYQKAN